MSVKEKDNKNEIKLLLDTALHVTTEIKQMGARIEELSLILEKNDFVKEIRNLARDIQSHGKEFQDSYAFRKDKINGFFK